MAEPKKTCSPRSQARTALDRVLDLHVKGKNSLEVFDRRNQALQQELVRLNRALSAMHVVS